MSGLYSIQISGLKEGRYTFSFEIDNKFFELFEESEIREGELVVEVELDKRSSHLDLRFRISGKVLVACDRCLEMYFQDIDADNRIVFKSGKTWDEDNPDLITIPADEYELDLKQYLYEFIHLALPLQRVHQDDENGRSTCDPDMLKRINGNSDDSDNDSDPRWDELKKLL
jgi:uncharacterized protein